MYEQHFGLTRRPFRAHATGTEVFVGPQSATMMASIKKALATEDSVVAVSGLAGVGKTTIAKRALDGVGSTRLMVSIGRIQLGHDEVLELLLAGLGARQLPKSTVQRFATFRRLLQQHAEKNMRVIVVVEDATRLGVTALAEIEALTAEDAGVSNGANVVLMGDAKLRELLRDPKLARLKQRVRLRQSVEPLSDKELLGYLKHHFRLAGGDFDSIFETGTCATLHQLSDGVPRVVNSLIESSLTASAEKNLGQVPVELIERIAAEEFGLTVGHKVSDIEEFVASAHDAGETVDRSPEPEPAPVVEEVDTELPVVETRDVVPEPEVAVAEDVAPAEVEEPASTADAAIPEFIQDTLPDLAILAPDLANLPEPDDVDDLPTLFSSGRMEQPATAPQAEVVEPPVVLQPVENKPAAREPVAEAPVLKEPVLEEPIPEEPIAEDPALEALAVQDNEAEEAPAEDTITEKTIAEVPPVETEASEEIPEWERDPTLAQLKPDLDALERAMAVAGGGEVAPPPKLVAEPAVPAEAEPEVPPEITLDREIQAKIDEATEALKQTHFDIEADVDAPDPEPSEISEGNTEELKKIASGLAKARTLEDVDDQLAETLFGEEFSMIAAQVMAKVPPDFSANDEIELQPDEPGQKAAPPAAKLDGAAAVSAQPEPGDRHGNVDNSPSQRLRTVRELNAKTVPMGAPPNPESTESIVMAVEPAAARPGAGAGHPQSIEEQIDTSMTATLKALSIRPESMPDEEDDDDEKKGGFFSRFRRS